jgi:hypothetical protein
MAQNEWKICSHPVDETAFEDYREQNDSEKSRMIT